MQHDETLEPMAREIMLKLLGIAPTDDQATQAVDTPETLLERIRALREARDTAMELRKAAETKRRKKERG